jgi:hypothetical protein
MPLSGRPFAVLATVLLTACEQWSGQAEFNSVIGPSTETNVIARSNETNIGNDSADLQLAAFEILSGKTREDAILLLEKQSFSCIESQCTYVYRYRDSFWGANFGIGQRERLPGSQLNKRLESKTVYTIAIRAARISQINDIGAVVSSTSNYD